MAPVYAVLPGWRNGFFESNGSPGQCQYLGGSFQLLILILILILISQV